jgi:GrpB-like predicted nucleotidyltransferase (UPF0157 family)
VNIDEPITIAPYSPAWVTQFASERAVLCHALSIEPSRVEHIGSTFVVGMHAKPIVDIMLGLDGFPPPPALADRFHSLGYEALGEAGIPGRIYFRKRLPTAFNVQAVSFGSPIWKNNLLLRDFLTTHSAEARRYADEKQRAFQAGHRTLLAYSAAKASILAELLAAAQRCNQVA